MDQQQHGVDLVGQDSFLLGRLLVTLVCVQRYISTGVVRLVNRGARRENWLSLGCLSVTLVGFQCNTNAGKVVLLHCGGIVVVETRQYDRIQSLACDSCSVLLKLVGMVLAQQHIHAGRQALHAMRPNCQQPDMLQGGVLASYYTSLCAYVAISAISVLNVADV